MPAFKWRYSSFKMDTVVQLSSMTACQQSSNFLKKLRRLVSLINLLSFQLCVVLIKTTKPYPKVERDEQEKSFLNTNEGVRIAFPSIDEPFSVLLSVIVPAFDEEVRRKFIIFTT